MKRHTKQRITGLLAVCLTFTAAVYGREGNPAAYRNGDRLCVRLPITAGIDLPANGQPDTGRPFRRWSPPRSPLSYNRGCRSSFP